ncbi:dihydropteroate synthase [Celeribacter baekdonensis]|uniref:Dihydropteroate synthase n=1 Tax=Celeribacter baekdonensis TaxID=875171 RepID=A0A2R4M360_9RHOB|nr:dihydropteroate synthase [Celeribacter baekdonensis]AVW91654.1 dihydropteroate synthase [Celeribacter baekdonensis]
MSSLYYRPIPSIDPARPSDALTLAGGWAWFSQVEVLSRAAPSRLIPATELPEEVKTRLTAPRAPLAGMDFARPNLMGILNVTPDSFSDGGMFDAPDAARVRAQVMMAEGADILDIGGESTRPGADYIAPELEITRTAPVIAAIRAGSTVPMSIDTRKAAVAAAALAAGADLINDVYAFCHDPELANVAAQSGAPVCLMHAQGDPEVMQEHPEYQNVLLDVYDFLAARIAVAEAAGISRTQILVDPGIGFGKTQAHNLALLQRISLFHALGCGVLLGVSRKGFIGRIGNAPEARDRAPGSIAVALAAVAQGIQVLRVHDIKETKQALALWQAVSGEGGQHDA